MTDLRDWGWTAFFEDQLSEEDRKTLGVFRVIEVQRGRYRILGERGEIWAETKGRLRFEAESSATLPAVGDWVLAGLAPGGTAVVERVLERRTVISRKASGNRKEEQVIAANVDRVVITSSLNGDLNLRRLERYLVMAWNSGAAPLVLLTKRDLCDSIEDKVRSVQEIAKGVPVIPASVVTGEGMDELRRELRPRETLVLVGSSGVGKSSLLNHLFGEERVRTGEIRYADGRGRHTTTSRTLYRLDNGAIVIDTPGVRELEPWGADEGLSATFADVEELFAACRFRDCRHGSEPGCAVREALETGGLPRDRWESYLKLQRESEFQDRKGDKAALAEQRKKWKSVAKALKDHYKKKKK